MKAFVIDVDGCLTDGLMYYTKEGKMMKAFSGDDHDALIEIEHLIKIHFVTGDYRGFPISQKRIVTDMGFSLDLVSAKDRIKWIDEHYSLKDTIYMGDGVFDCVIFKEVGYSICPNDGFYKAISQADYVTFHNGGHRAVAEACIYIKEKFFV